MRAHQHAAPLIVVRSEAESGRVGLRLIGELDLNTVELLDAELSASREQAPPSVIDLSELRFLDLIGLRALMRAVQGDAEAPTRLVGATGIVRRLMELARVLDADSTGAAAPPHAGEPTTRITAERREAVVDAVAHAAANGTNTNGLGAAAMSTNGDAA